jgi:phenylalanyl-tRNA synthetase beta chain
LDVLVSFGFAEAVNYSFTTPSREELFLGSVKRMVEIANPLSEMGTHLRTTLIPGLVDAVRHNLNHGNEDVRLFEMGSIYLSESEKNAERIVEPARLALVACGSFYNPFWSQIEDRFSFAHLKGVVEVLCSRLGFPVDIQQATEIPFLHPGISAEIIGAGTRIGLLGELHPKLKQFYKFSDPVFLAEISLKEIYSKELQEPRYEETGKFPSVERDFSFLIDRSIEFSKIRLAVQALKIAELREFRLIDLYQGQNLPEDKLSLTVRLEFSDPSRTLTQEDVNDRCECIFSVLKAEFGVQPR